MNKIKLTNLVSSVSNVQEYLSNLAEKKPKKTKTSKDTYFKYNINKCLKTNFHDIKLKEGAHINICCFRIVESTKYSDVLYPYLQYLLYKYPNGNKKESNLCLFPFKEYKKNMKVKEEGKKIVKDIFNKQYNCLGYLMNNDEVFLFYDVDVKNLDERILLKKNNKFWWTLIDEICNNKQLLNFPIHGTTTNLFLKNPKLIYLLNRKNENIEVPVVAYRGDYFDFLPYLFIVGQKSTTSAPFGPYYYFTNFTGSFRRAVWSTNYKMAKVDNKLITDENGRFKKGGIIRYLVFLNKTKVILNKKNDTMKSELLKDYQNPETWRKRKNIGKWAARFDSLLLNKIKIDSENYYNYTPMIIIKNLENIRALTIHEVDMSSIKTNWDPLYTKYNIL
tara:strand:+ start:4345 stop:5514 length:1170 start_codon:yes stop_codon:yes gene_type:complete